VVAARLPSGVERIVVENKCDLAQQAPERLEFQGKVHLRLSARTGEGLALLKEELLRVVGWQVDQGENVILARQRHLDALVQAARRIEAAAVLVPQLEVAAEELRLAQDALSAITGEFSADDLLGEIFNRFCIGK
jgi:tRNA modification GTPase